MWKKLKTPAPIHALFRYSSNMAPFSNNKQIGFSAILCCTVALGYHEISHQDSRQKVLYPNTLKQRSPFYILLTKYISTHSQISLFPHLCDMQYCEGNADRSEKSVFSGPCIIEICQAVRTIKCCFQIFVL